MLIPLRPVIVPTAEQMSLLDDFAALARARTDALRLYTLIPTPSLWSRIAAADCVLVRGYEALVSRGYGLEAAAILSLYRAPHVRLACERRAA